MERKIGEIFKYNGEWYQCVVAIQGCRECSFRTQDYCTHLLECFSDIRSDKTSVIFKKLEKVGEPYEYFVLHRGIVTLQPYKLFTTPIIDGVVCNVHYDTNTIDLEIKQTKEDMEEKKIQHYDCFFDRKPTLKEFDINLAKQGKPVYTRDGRKARIICFDYKGDGNAYPILALISTSNLSGVPSEIIAKYTEDGKYAKYNNVENGEDLMMLLKKKEGWVNVYKERIYSTKEEAIEATYDGVTYIDTVKVCWEE